MARDRIQISLNIPTKLKDLIQEHADQIGLSFAYATMRLSNVAFISTKKLAELKKVVDGLEKIDNGGVRVSTVKESETVNRYVQLLHVMNYKVDLAEEMTMFTVGVPHNFHKKLQNNAVRNKNFMNIQIGVLLIQGILIMMAYYSHKKFISSAILNNKIKTGDANYNELVNSQNFINLIDEILAEADGSQIEEFELVKKKILVDLREKNNGLVLGGQTNTPNPIQNDPISKGGFNN